MDNWQTPFHIEFICPAVAAALFNFPRPSESDSQDRPWLPRSIEVRRSGPTLKICIQSTCYGRQEYEVIFHTACLDINWHHAFRMVVEDANSLAILHLIYNGLLQLHCRHNSQPQHLRGRSDADFQVTFEVRASKDSMYCNTVATDDFLIRQSVHSRVTSEQCREFSRRTHQASEAEASCDPSYEHPYLHARRGFWPIRKRFKQHTSLTQSEDDHIGVFFDNYPRYSPDSSLNIKIKTEDDPALLESNNQRIGSIDTTVVEQPDQRVPFRCSLPTEFIKLGTSGATWKVSPHQSSFDPPALIQQQLESLLHDELTGNERDFGCLSMIYVMYVPELDRFKIGSVRQRRLDGELEPVANFQKDGCLRRMAEIRKSCGYRRLEVGYQSKPLEVFFARRVERFIHRALSAVADRICCLRTEPMHSHIEIFDAEFRVIQYIIEKSLVMVPGESLYHSSHSSPSELRPKASEPLQDFETGMRKIVAAPSDWEHPVDIVNRFYTALLPGAADHIEFHADRLSLEDQHLILHIFDTHRFKHQKTLDKLENLDRKVGARKIGEEIIGLITLVDGVPALDDWKVLPSSKSIEADESAWEPLLSVLPSSSEHVLDFIAGCLLKSRCHDKLSRYLRLYQQLSQLH